MSVWSDGTIRDHLSGRVDNPQVRVSPYDARLVGPAGIDVRLGSRMLVYSGNSNWEQDIPAEGWLLRPELFVLGHTLEHVRIGADVAAELRGKSSLGRLGLVIHQTAGWIDPGFEGQITLELSCVHPVGVWLWPDMPIGQLTFTNLDRPAARPYGHPLLGSHYQGQMGPTASWME